MPLKIIKANLTKKSNYVQAKLKFTTKSQKLRTGSKATEKLCLEKTKKKGQKLEGLREMFSERLRPRALTVQIWVSLFSVPLPTKHPSLCYSHSEGKHSTLIKWVTTGHRIWL